MKLPPARGPLSALVVERLAGPASDEDGLTGPAREAVAGGAALDDEDLQLSLWLLHELHHRGFDDVDPGREWETALVATRVVLERALEATLRATVTVPRAGDDVAETLFAMTAPTPGPSLSRYVARSADAEQARELVVHRSLYQLAEADPHTWAIPRLSGRAKAALVEIQADEYGGGDPERMHSALFARTMRGVGLVDEYGYYVDRVPAVTLAHLSTMRMLGLNRRLRGAAVGHLAAFEMTSSLPNRRYGDGFRRLGFDAATTEYFDEHVEADAVHEQIAARDMAGGLVADEPELRDDVLFGAAACLATDELVADAMLAAWRAGRSSLREAR
ncbi:iron-containing redox enzyme family protein [Cellulomonas sp. DKR-3]|uniref:Iron-containing redox enzyme family protein n=1 Tax=Cellulomonas fulva TaxID=2835530 RepID=A0ABS5TZI7_9CELL|nr:iron-containing redox enzyme family protein [Cellulomonas fulva]MBT0994512.1 iron-containing redox enzyme family protein [Cellulomonas fulva]